MKPKHIQNYYEAKILEFGTHAHYCCKEIEDGKTSKECLWELAESQHATMIVCGNNGRKGPKKDETVIGTAVEYLSINSKFPIMIIKDPKHRDEKPDHCLRYGVCFDGSSHSTKAL